MQREPEPARAEVPGQDLRGLLHALQGPGHLPDVQVQALSTYLQFYIIYISTLSTPYYAS